MNECYRFDLEGLESRTFLSVTPTGPSTAPPTVPGSPIVKLPFPVRRFHGLWGGASGTYTRSVSVPDIGATYTFIGSGRVRPLGADSVAGSLQAPGLILNGMYTGTLTLTNAKGSVTVSLQGVAANVPSSAALTVVKLTYTIIQGTGSYQNRKGTGQVNLVLEPGPTVSPVAAAPNQSGRFIFTFESGVVPLA